MSEQQPATAFSWIETNPSQNIELAQYHGYRDANPVPMITTYKGFFKLLSAPQPGVFTKEGDCYLLGPCNGRRSKRNLKMYWGVVIDGDKSIDQGGKEIEGSPPPLTVHQVLKQANLTHCLHTTFSHGSEKGNRFRLFIPAIVRTELELKAMALYYTNLLQEAGLPLALCRESYVWGQGWAMPRIAYEDADFEAYHHWGYHPDPAALVEVMGLKNVLTSKLPPSLHEAPVADDSPIGLVAKCMPIQQQLLEHNYEFVSQGLMLDHKGNEVPVLRYRMPGSKSAPGVVVFKSEGRWRAYSHHTNDKLSNGHSNDAFDVYRLLNDKPDEGAALLSVVPALQEYIEDEMDSEYPSILEGGAKFRFGNTYVDDFGSLTYRMLEPATFTAIMKNRSGVPTITVDDNGNQHLTMVNRAEYWNKCPRRQLYNGIVYTPCHILEEPELVVEKAGKPYFNLFRSWHVTPRRGTWALLEWHLRNAICGGNEEEYEYLLNWFSHLVQMPHDKPGVALVLQGGRGWGKSIFLSEIAKKLGTHAMVVGNNKLLTGNFNHHLRDLLLLIAEESFWSGSYKDRGIMQHTITDSVTGYEKKGVDAEAGLSLLRIALISNNDWVAPAASDERRYFLPSVSSAAKERDIVNKKKGHFFPSLIAEMQGGGIEAFLYDMAMRSIEDVVIRSVPDTEKLYEQKEISLDWLDKWVMHCLMVKEIRSEGISGVPWRGNGCTVTTEILQTSLKEHCPMSVAYSDRGLLTSFGIRLKKIFPRELFKRISRPEGIIYYFGKIESCRAAYESYVQFPIDWGQEDKPVPISAGQQDVSIRH